MDVQVTEYVTNKLFIGNPISDAFWLIDNRKAAVFIFLLGLCATCYRSYLEKHHIASIASAKQLIQMRAWDLIGFVMMALGVFSYSYGLLDETFINLVHPLNLINHGIFSFNPQKKIDGTVENLFYFFHIIGGSPQGIIRFNFLFSFCLYLASAVIVSSLFDSSPLQKLIRNLYILFPPLVFAASSGFGAVFLNFLFLLGVYSIIKNKKILLSFTVAIIALSRPEGILFSMVLVITGFLYSRQIMLPFLMTIFGTLGFFCFSYFYYGHWIPTPLYFKAMPPGCQMHFLHLFKRGIAIFIHSPYDSEPRISSFALYERVPFIYHIYQAIWRIFVCSALLVGLIETLHALIQRFYKKKMLKPWAIYAILLIGVLPLFIIYTKPPGSLGGQSRYFIVHMSMTFLVLVSLLHLKDNLSVPWLYRYATRFLLTLFYIYISYLYFGARIELIYNRNFDANVGLLFKSLPAHFTLSSSEIDTLGFFSERPIIDLWGYTNTVISQSGLYHPRYGKKVNPNYFLQVLPAIEYNTLVTSKIDWANRSINQFGDKADYDYSLSAIFNYPPKQRRDEGKGFLFPSELSQLVNTTAIQGYPAYHGNPVKVFKLYDVIFIHDNDSMFGFLLRKDFNRGFEDWAAKQGIKKISSKITTYLPPLYYSEDYASTELPCKYYHCFPP